MLRRLTWALTLGASVALCAVTAAPPQRAPNLGHSAPLLPRLEMLRALGAPFIHMVADYFWIQTIHAVGEARTRYDFRDVYDYAELVTELDPHLRHVYAFAGAVIPYQTGPNTWVNTEESTHLLEKGVKYFPEHVFTRILLAYNYSAFLHDYARAAKTLDEASRLPGAPTYLGALATRMYARAGELDAGMALAEALVESAEEPELREAMERRRAELELEHVLEGVDAAIARYRERVGHLPASVEALVRAGDLAAVPADPLGGAIVLGPDGRSRSTQQARRVSDIGGEPSMQSQESP